MKKLVWLLVPLVAGCAYTRYSDERVAAYRLSFGVDSKANKMYVTSTEKSTTIRIGELESKEAESVGSAVGAAINALK
jgi:hypothetical protein